MTDKFKVGLDIHGVIDTFPERFKFLSKALYESGAEVHIITGIKRDKTVEQLLDECGIRFTHYFSIVEHLEAKGTHIEWKNMLPYTDENEWNRAKRDYCKKHNIDFMFDDSPVYKETFHDIDTTYLHLINRNRTIYETR